MSAPDNSGAAAAACHTELRVTLEDALRALDDATTLDRIAPARVFLEGLHALLPADGSYSIDSDADGYIVDGAFQSGFQMADDNGDLLVVSVPALIAFVNARQAFMLAKGRREGEGLPDEDGELWRFLMRSATDGSPEQKIMETLADALDENGLDSPEQFEKIVRDGLAQQRAERAATP